MGTHWGCGGSTFVTPFHQTREPDCTGPAQAARGLWIQFSWQQGAVECFIDRDMARAKQCFRKINLKLHDRLIDRATIGSAEKGASFRTKPPY